MPYPFGAGMGGAQRLASVIAIRLSGAGKS
jgi:hypothetical protein